MYEDVELPNYWPPFLESKYLERTLAYYDTGRLTLENGNWIDLLPDLLVSALFEKNLLTFVDSLIPLFPLIRAAGGHIYCNNKGLATSAKLRAKNRSTRWIVACSQWDYAKPSLVMLEDLRRLFDHVGCGTVTTPGSLGQSSMRRAWKLAYGNAWTEHRHQRPAAYVCEDLYAHSTGARSELIDTAKHYRRLVEVDQKNAYAYAYEEQPTGWSLRFWNGLTSPFKVWVGNCIVEIKEQLIYGPFPFKQEGMDTSYPTQPASYHCWLWSNEAELCMAEGCVVTVLDGWGWYATTRDPAEWVELASRLRDTAPDQRSEELWKLCMVAAIGRMGMRPEHHELIDAPLSPDDVRVLGKDQDGTGIEYDWWVHQTKDEHPTALPHWMQYALAKCRETLFTLNKPFVQAEWSVQTNTDAALQKEEALPYIQANFKHKSEHRETGEFGYRILTPAPDRDSVVVPFNRGIISCEKTTLPGKAKQHRRPP